jgi:hypothetical protein
MSEEEVRQVLTDSFHLYVELSQGRLDVGHLFDRYKDVLSIGKGKKEDFFVFSCDYFKTYSAIGVIRYCLLGNKNKNTHK